MFSADLKSAEFWCMHRNIVLFTSVIGARMIRMSDIVYVTSRSVLSWQILRKINNLSLYHNLNLCKMSTPSLLAIWWQDIFPSIYMFYTKFRELRIFLENEIFRWVFIDLALWYCCHLEAIDTFQRDTPTWRFHPAYEQRPIRDCVRHCRSISYPHTCTNYQLQYHVFFHMSISARIS